MTRASWPRKGLPIFKFHDMARTKKTVEQELAEYAEARKKTNAEIVRERIQTVKLVELLNSYALGNSKAKLTGPRLKAIEMLLDKSLPDLAAIKHEVQAQQVTFMIAEEPPKA